jgi:hypothetical protein
MTPHFRPAWLAADRPSSIFTKGKYLMSLFSKLTNKTANSISPAARFESDLDRAISDALDRGIHVSTLISILETREQSARSRVAAAYRSGPVFECGNID